MHGSLKMGSIAFSGPIIWALDAGSSSKSPAIGAGKAKTPRKSLFSKGLKTFSGGPPSGNYYVDVDSDSTMYRMLFLLSRNCYYFVFFYLFPMSNSNSI